MGFTVWGAEKMGHAVAEGDEAEEIALLFGCQRQKERGGDVALEDGCIRIIRNGTGTEAGSIEDDINLLGSLDLKYAGDGMATAGGGFPVNLVETVSGSVFAEFFELAPFSHLTLSVHAQAAALEEGRRFLALGRE